VLSLLFGAFVLLALVVRQAGADSFDVQVSQTVQHATSLDGLMRWISWLWYMPQTLMLDALVLCMLVLLGLRLEAVAVLLTLLGESAANALAKYLVARPRPGPTLVHILHPVSGYSFPSGHVMGFMAFFGIVAYMAWRRLDPGLVRGVIIGTCIVLVVLVGPSRIYLGAHWATDVIGGYLLGFLWLYLAIQCYEAWIRRTSTGISGPARGRSQ
jgi:undecaprenyl-diphosphatase